MFAPIYILLPEVWQSKKYPLIEPVARQSSLRINPLDDSCSLEHSSSGTRAHAYVQSTRLFAWTSWFGVSWLLWLFLTVDTWQFVSFVGLAVAYRSFCSTWKRFVKSQVSETRFSFAVSNQPWRLQHLRKGRRSLPLLTMWCFHWPPVITSAKTLDLSLSPNITRSGIVSKLSAWELLGLHGGPDLQTPSIFNFSNDDNP